MKRILTALLVCLLMVTSCEGIVDIGDPSVSRLWVEDGRFACTATYLRPIGDAGAWIITAGHCSGASYLKRNTNETMVAKINWRISVTSHNYSGRTIDLALGTAPDVRDERKFRSFMAEKMPDSGEVYIHGFPGGVERVSTGEIIGPSETFPGTVEIRVKPGSIIGGSSGSTVLDRQGFIVGILWGIGINPATGEPTDIALVTPIEAVHEAIKLIDAKL